MKRKLARSLGPRQLVRALTQRDHLAAEGQPVTFLTEVDPDAPEACDVWDYGCGAELGAYVFVDTLDLEVKTSPREDHDPDTHPGHLWVENDGDPFPFDAGVLVRDPAEMACAARASTTAEALAALEAHRGRPHADVEEEVLAEATALDQECARIRGLTASLTAMDDEEARAARLAAHGLTAELLTTDPEHMNKALRAAIEGAAADLEP